MRLIEQHWYQPRGWLTALLAPLEGLFALLAALRRQAFRRGWKTSERLAVPVVVIGNINVGGVGKTPLTLALLRDFAARGVKAGVISRGYGGAADHPGLDATAIRPWSATSHCCWPPPARRWWWGAIASRPAAICWRCIRTSS
ncbi:tetraacyldisaccharide 4'-kinase [Chromobacterium piscinae]|uniref:tetraacyldisaccharide 4'-kinase n=1 Tax=Chromobacterium piscinae TaxID=686831 RepID=UPI0032611567